MERVRATSERCIQTFFRLISTNPKLFQEAAKAYAISSGKGALYWRFKLNEAIPLSGDVENSLNHRGASMSDEEFYATFESFLREMKYLPMGITNDGSLPQLKRDLETYSPSGGEYVIYFEIIFTSDGDCIRKSGLVKMKAPSKESSDAFSHEEQCRQIEYMRTHCANCARGAKLGGKLQRCSRCKLVHYCCRACQSADWKKHRVLCGEIQKSLAMAAETMKKSSDDDGKGKKIEEL